ncbi:MAG: hypothetical protein EXS58_12385 [Candidatus Latescibacteria bacterium]|nr:hypothetical protein [Candidatus Latescibacterota bacterium]
MWRRAIAFLSALVLVPLAAGAESFDAQKMHRDLGIAETILVHLQGGEDLPFANPVRGVYLKGYGAVFLSAGQNRNLLVALMGSPQEQAEAAKKTPGGDFEVFKEQTAEFFRSYADAIAQVGEEDRITVLSGDLGSGTPGALGWMGWGKGRGRKMMRKMFAVETPADSAGSHPKGEKMFEAEVPPPGGPGPKPGGPGPKPEEDLFFRVQKELEAAAPEPAIFEGSVKKADLRALHRGRLSEEDFAKHLTWQQHRPDPVAAKQVDIMAGILDKALAGEGQGLRCSGVYHEGLGALFFVNLGFGKIFSALTPARFDRTQPVMPQIEAVTDEQEVLIKAELVKAVAEYGHALPLKPDEYLVVEVHSGGPPKMCIDLLLRVRQEELEAYRKGTLSLVEFGQKVEFEE